MRHLKLSRSFRDTIWNLSGAGVSTIILVVTVPGYLALLGMERYGMLALLWALLGYFGFFDLGLSRAAVNFGARATPGPELDSIFWTTLLLNSCLGCIGGLVFLSAAAAGLLEMMFRVSSSVHQELMGTSWWIAAFLPFVTVGSVFTGLLEARGRFDVANVMQILGSCLFQGAPLLAALVFGPRLDVVVPAALIARGAVIVVTGFVVMRLAPIGSVTPPNFLLARRMFTFGGWATVTSLVSPLLTTLDQFVIGGTVDVRMLPQYSVPGALAQRFSILPYAVVRTLFPRFSRLGVADAAVLLLGRASRVLAAVLSPAIGIAVLTVEPFLHLWIGSTFASESGTIARILLLGAWFNGLAFIPFVYLEGVGRPDLPAKFHMLEIVPYVAVLYVGLRFGGLTGAAAACTLRMVVDALLLSWRSGCGLRLSAMLTPNLAIVVSCLLVAQSTSDPRHLISAGVCAVLCGLGWGTIIAPELVAMAFSRDRPNT